MIQKSVTNTFKTFIDGNFDRDNSRCEKNNNCLVLLDKKVDRYGNEEDRPESKSYDVESSESQVKQIIKTFGYPYFHWNRHINQNKIKDSLFPDSTWIKLKNKDSNHFGLFDSNELFVTEPCSNDIDTECDYLNCGVRKKDSY